MRACVCAQALTFILVFLCETAPESEALCRLETSKRISNAKTHPKISWTEESKPAAGLSPAASACACVYVREVLVGGCASHVSVTLQSVCVCQCVLEANICLHQQNHFRGKFYIDAHDPVCVCVFVMLSFLNIKFNLKKIKKTSIKKPH